MNKKRMQTRTDIGPGGQPRTASSDRRRYDRMVKRIADGESSKGLWTGAKNLADKYGWLLAKDIATRKK
jgi:hypothetical protein